MFTTQNTVVRKRQIVIYEGSYWPLPWGWRATRDVDDAGGTHRGAGDARFYQLCSEVNPCAAYTSGGWFYREWNTLVFSWPCWYTHTHTNIIIIIIIIIIICRCSWDLEGSNQDAGQAWVWETEHFRPCEKGLCYQSCPSLLSLLPLVHLCYNTHRHCFFLFEY